MHLLNDLKFSLRILKAINSCKRDEFIALMDTVMAKPAQSDRERYFKQRRFIWNIVRGKDYYKMMSFYVVHQFEYSKKFDDGTTIMADANWIIHIVLETTRDETIRKSFIWSIMKSIPLLTIDTIQYASPEKIHSILTSDKDIICDEYVTPFLSEIKDLRTQAQADKDQLALYQTMLES